MCGHPLTVSCHPDWSSASRDIKYLICQATSQNHVIKQSSALWHCRYDTLICKAISEGYVSNHVTS